VQGITYKLVLTDAANTVLQTEDNIQGINDQVLNPPSEWMAQGAPTYLSPTSFSVPGNQTATFDVGRRVKSINTGGTAYSTVTGSTYNAGPNTTTVTVVNDSLPLDSGLSAVYAGVLDPAGSSVPVADIYWYNAITLRNRLINGDTRVDQRNVGGLVAITNVGGNAYTVDRWGQNCSLGIGTGTMNVQRVGPPGVAPVAPPAMGNPYALSYSVAVAKVSLGTADFASTTQYIEGLQTADLLWGTSAAKSITISFTFQTSIANAVVSIAIRNAAVNRSYATTVTTGAANTPARYSVTIPGDTTGTWAIDNTSGLQVWFAWASGSTLIIPSPNTWTAGNYVAAPGLTNFMSNVANTWQLTDVQLEAGTAASPFERIGYDVQLARCQRYYEKSFQASQLPANNLGDYTSAHTFVQTVGASSLCYSHIKFIVRKRGVPTITLYNPLAANGNYRNTNAGVDCGAPSAAYTADTSVLHSMNSGVGTSIGSLNVVGWTADAELY